MNPPGIFKKKKGQRNLGEKFNSKFYPDNYKKDVLYMNYEDLLDNLYMGNKGIDFGLRSYKNYNEKNKKKKKKNLEPEKQKQNDKNKDVKIEFRINKTIKFERIITNLHLSKIMIIILNWIIII